MAFTLYATYLYGTPEKRAQATSGEPPSEYQLPNVHDEADETAPALEQKR
jgi:hypothetical protein